jgi:hypothetical protein
MEKRMKIKWAVLAMSAMVLCMVATVYADTIVHNQVVVKSGETVVSYDLDEVKTEVEDGKTKVCICRCLCFRALQMLATRFADGVIPRDDIKIVTGWTTDGPEELFVEVMGWSSGDLTPMAGATAAAHLTIEDAYFFFIQKSTGKAWKVVANEGLYPQGFFAYRTLVKTGQATDEQKDFFQTALRPQAVINMETLPLIDKFDILAVPFYGEDGILHIPACFASGGGEYEVELRNLGNGVFELIKVVNAD